MSPRPPGPSNPPPNPSPDLLSPEEQAKALFSAVFKADVPALRKLLAEDGLPADLRDEQGRTPLHFAAWGTDQREMVSLLIAHGADVNARSGDGSTPLLNCLSLSDDDRVARMLLDRGAQPNLANADGETPAMVAACNGRTKSLQLLIARGADVTLHDKAGRDAAVYAASANAPAVKQLIDEAARRGRSRVTQRQDRLRAAAWRRNRAPGGF